VVSKSYVREYEVIITRKSIIEKKKSDIFIYYTHTLHCTTGLQDGWRATAPTSRSEGKTPKILGHPHDFSFCMCGRCNTLLHPPSFLLSEKYSVTGPKTMKNLTMKEIKISLIRCIPLCMSLFANMCLTTYVCATVFVRIICSSTRPKESYQLWRVVVCDQETS
jgi:hypothetical protein